VVAECSAEGDAWVRRPWIDHADHTLVSRESEGECPANFLKGRGKKRQTRAISKREGFPKRSRSDRSMGT